MANANDTDIKSVIQNHMDLNQILSYAVVDRAIRHDDGPFHWYGNLWVYVNRTIFLRKSYYQ